MSFHSAGKSLKNDVNVGTALSRPSDLQAARATRGNTKTSFANSLRTGRSVGFKTMAATQAVFGVPVRWLVLEQG